MYHNWSKQSTIDRYRLLTVCFKWWHGEKSCTKHFADTHVCVFQICRSGLLDQKLISPVLVDNSLGRNWAHAHLQARCDREPASHCCTYTVLSRFLYLPIWWVKNSAKWTSVLTGWTFFMFVSHVCFSVK